jgi:hypothetical protein
VPPDRERIFDVRLAYRHLVVLLVIKIVLPSRYKTANDLVRHLMKIYPHIETGHLYKLYGVPNKITLH